MPPISAARPAPSPKPAPLAPPSAAGTRPALVPAPVAPASPKAVDGFDAGTAARKAISSDTFDAGPAKKSAAAKAVITEETPRDLSDAKQRTSLATQTSQVNAVSVDAGNFEDLCAGAAVVNALVLNSTTPQAAKANAAALEKTADLHKSWSALPASVDRKDVQSALTNLAAGKPSERDLQHLQQLAYATGLTLEPRATDAGPLSGGTNAAQLGALAAELQFNGAQLGDSRFVQVKGEGDTTGHWVVESGKVVANSLSSVKVDASQLKPASSAWDSDVRVKKSDSSVQVRLRRASAQDELPRGKAYVLQLSSADLAQQLLKGPAAAQMLKAFKDAKAAGGQKVE